jgi:hypothetical protein
MEGLPSNDAIDWEYNKDMAVAAQTFDGLHTPCKLTLTNFVFELTNLNRFQTTVWNRRRTYAAKVASGQRLEQCLYRELVRR